MSVATEISREASLSTAVQLGQFSRSIAVRARGLARASVLQCCRARSEMPGVDLAEVEGLAESVRQHGFCVLRGVVPPEDIAMVREGFLRARDTGSA